MKVKRLILTILSLLPFKAVAFAADSRLTTLAGEEANAKSDWDSLIQKKSILFGPLELATTREKAFERFLDQSGLEKSPEANQLFDATVEKMILDGTITTDEKMLMSSIPSIRGG